MTLASIPLQATGGEEHAYGEDAPPETTRSELEQRDDEAMLQKLAGQLQSQRVEESPAVTSREELSDGGNRPNSQASTDLASSPELRSRRGSAAAPLIGLPQIGASRRGSAFAASPGMPAGTASRRGSSVAITGTPMPADRLADQQMAKMADMQVGTDTS